MKKTELKSIINECVEEVYIEKSLRESFDYDLQRLNQTLIAEGFFDSTKKIMQSVPAKAKQTLAQPLIYAILDRVKKTDPKGFEQLKQYADDPNKLNQLINHEKIKQQTDKINKELANAPVNEGDVEFEESFQRYLSEALYRQKTSPKNADTSKNYDWSKSVEDNIPKKEVPKQKYSLKKKDPSVPQKYENPDTFPTPDEISKQNPEKKSEDPSKDKKGISLSNIADKAGILAIKGLGKAGELVGKGISKLAQTDAGKKAGQAGMGIVSKVSSYMKKHPKLTAGVALALIASIGTAAAIGSGGVVPLITSTVTAGAGGAVKGGIFGTAIGAGKEMYSQIKGGAKSFKDIDYKKVGKAGLKAGGKGAAIGAAVGAGANVLGKAAAGISKIFSSGQVTSNPNSFLKDLTPEEQRALGIEGKTWAEKFNPDDPSTWKIKPKINSTNGYNIARQENELLYKGITGKDASDIINTKAAAGQTANIGSGFAKKASQDANKIVKLLSDPSASNQNLGFDYQMTKDLNLGDVLRAGNPSGTGPDTDAILRQVEILIQQGNQEQAAKLLSSKIANGLSSLDKSGELAKSGISAAADAAGQTALAAKQAAAGEKARQALEWLKNASPQDLANNSGLPGIRNILGTTGQGAGESFTRNAVRAFNMGAGNEEGLLKIFTKLAMDATN